jgi:DNA repair exonuclease SbcCD nuclease subunit
MKILHIADTHLGYSAYRKVNNEGFNQREIDNYNAFKEFINYAIKIKPDLILHAGDLFDSVRPNNRAITFTLNQIIKLSNNNIPFVVIAGNHEHPKLKETGHIFSVFDNIKNIYPIYKSKYEKLSFMTNNNKLTIHAVPQSSSKEEYNLNLEKIKRDPNSDYNILITHGSVRGIRELSMNEFNELFLPKKYIDSFFDYVALGHYHEYKKVGKNAFYSGSTECFSFSDANTVKGFIELKIENNEIYHKFITINTRKVIDLNPIDCSNININQLMKKISDVIDELKPDNKVFRLVLKDIEPTIYRTIDFGYIRKKCMRAVYHEIKPKMVQRNNFGVNISSNIESLSNELKLFINSQDICNKDVILKIGMKYLDKIERFDKK